MHRKSIVDRRSGRNSLNCRLRSSAKLMEKTLNQQYKEIIRYIFQKYFKPLHYKKENGNFRFIHEDGLGKIVSFRSSWCNSEVSFSFCLSAGIYFEEGENIRNQKFKEELCRMGLPNERWYKLTQTADISSLISAISKAVEEYILPFLEAIDTKEKAINAVLTSKYGLDYDTADLLIHMGYGKEIFPKLLERPIYYENLLRIFEKEMTIPIFEDKQIYRVYLVLKKQKYNNNELRAFAEIRGMSLRKASEELETDNRMLAEGEAMFIKKVSEKLKGYCVNYVIEPEFPY